MEDKTRMEIRSSQDNKRKELCEKIEKIVQKDGNEVFNYLEDEGYIEMTSPSYEEGSLEWTEIRIKKNNQVHGRSIKLGNIYLNLKNALLSNSSIIINGTTSPIAFFNSPTPFAGVVAVSSLLAVAGLTCYDLYNQAATVLAIAFENKDCPQCNTEQIRILTNQYFNKHDMEEISKNDFSTILGELENCHCISIVDDKIKIVDRIIIRYE